MDLKQIKKQLNESSELVFSKLGMTCEIFSDNIYSTCPVHEGSDNPRAFSYSLKKGIWKCWTRDCQQEHGNDIFGVIKGALSAQRGEDVDFAGALKWSCDLLGINKGNVTTTKKPEQEEDEFFTVVKLLSSDNTKYQHKPIKVDCELNYPSKYFIDRGFNKETLDYFQVGDCKDCKSSLNERAVIPIHDDHGKDVVGLIGRTIREYRSPKFLFYPKGFDKRYFFYNYHRAINRAIETSCLFIVEGQGDVWKLYEAGVINAVSIFGKTISQEQEDKLHKLPITHLIILTDNDQAGREAKIQIKRQFSRLYKLTFPRFSTKDIGDMSVDQIQNKILSKLKGTY